MDTLYRLDRTVIEVAGPNARTFLQDLLTQDLDRLDAEGIQYAALLTPQGKVIGDVLLWSWGADVLIDIDPTRAEAVMRRLDMYNLRHIVRMHHAETIEPVVWSMSAFEGARRDPRLETLGWRGFATPGTTPPDGTHAFESTRLALGVPDLGRDALPDEVFGLEALLEELNGVDFKKGCFVGQENVSRMKRRATTRKKFCPIVFEGKAPAYGAAITAGAAELGFVRTGADGRAIALLRLDRTLTATEPLMAEGRPVRLAPPDWLALPAADA